MSTLLNVKACISMWSASHSGHASVIMTVTERCEGSVLHRPYIAIAPHVNQGSWLYYTDIRIRKFLTRTHYWCSATCIWSNRISIESVSSLCDIAKWGWSGFSAGTSGQVSVLCSHSCSKNLRTWTASFSNGRGRDTAALYRYNTGLGKVSHCRWSDTAWVPTN